eukprot:gene19236-19621_t
MTMAGVSAAPSISTAEAAEPHVPAVGRPESEIEAISRARFKALVDRNADYLKSHYTDDFQAVGPDGKRVGIRFLEWIVKNEPKDANYEPFDYRVFISADATQAVAYHKTHDTWDGQKSDVSYTEVFVKRNGHWLVRFEQYGEIHQPEKAKS